MVGPKGGHRTVPPPLNTPLSQLLSKVTVTSCSFHVKIVQCVRFAAGRRTEAGDATNQWRDQPNARQFPHSVLQLVDCREFSTLIEYLLKGLSNCIIDEI